MPTFTFTLEVEVEGEDRVDAMTRLDEELGGLPDVIEAVWFEEFEDWEESNLA